MWSEELDLRTVLSQPSTTPPLDSTCGPVSLANNEWGTEQ